MAFFAGVPGFSGAGDWGFGSFAFSWDLCISFRSENAPTHVNPKGGQFLRDTGLRCRFSVEGLRGSGCFRCL